MDDEIDYDLTRDQWETLKKLRVPASRLSALNQFVLDELLSLGLVTMSSELPVITPKGRKVLVRGSSRLWDVAA
jgi:ribosomal protein S19E (S16A)